MGYFNIKIHLNRCKLVLKYVSFVNQGILKDTKAYKHQIKKLEDRTARVLSQRISSQVKSQSWRMQSVYLKLHNILGSSGSTPTKIKFGGYLQTAV